MDFLVHQEYRDPQGNQDLKAHVALFLALRAMLVFLACRQTLEGSLGNPVSPAREAVLVSPVSAGNLVPLAIRAS